MSVAPDAQPSAPEKRAREGADLEVEYRAKRTNSLPDIAANGRKWAAERPASGDEAAIGFEGLIPAVLRTLMRPRVTTFDLLTTELGLPFSLDNGVVLQELVLQRLPWVRAPRRSETDTDSAATTRRLWKERQPRTVWWEARTVRVWTWPAELRAALVEACRGVLACVRTAEPRSDANRCGEEKHRGLEDLSAACAPCTWRLLEMLRGDYKCVSL